MCFQSVILIVVHAHLNIDQDRVRQSHQDFLLAKYVIPLILVGLGGHINYIQYDHLWHDRVKYFSVIYLCCLSALSSHEYLNDEMEGFEANAMVLKKNSRMDTDKHLIGLDCNITYSLYICKIDMTHHVIPVHINLPQTQWSLILFHNSS